VLSLLLLQKLLLVLDLFSPRERMPLLEEHQQQVRELVHQQQVQMLKVQQLELERQMEQLDLVVILPQH
jgi:hypothetical protein